MGPIAYSYDPKTKIYSGPVRAQECKIQIGQFYNPRFSTFKKPPEGVPGRSIYWNAEKDLWEYGAPPVVVQKPVVSVEKVSEVRENPELLKQVVENERMILAIELEKKLKAQKDSLVDLVMSLNSRVEALEAALSGMRAVIQDNAQTANSSMQLVMSVEQTVSNLSESISAIQASVIERIEMVEKMNMRIIEGVESVESVETVSSEKLVSSLASKPKWKFWG